MEDDGSKLMWLLAGVAIGASAALLMAPASGKRTRRYLNQATREGREAAQEGGHDLIERGRELYDRGKEIVEDAADLFERGRKLVQG